MVCYIASVVSMCVCAVMYAIHVRALNIHDTHVFIYDD